ncbi:MAG: hypothetical protein V4438_00300 [Patescibacteria group bacterium]
MLQNPKTKKGLSLIEVVLYSAILIIAMSLLIYTFERISVSYGRVKSSKAIEESATYAIDRMAREINSGTSIDVAASTLGSTPGRLFLYTIDENNASSTSEFYLSGQTLHIKVAGVDQGPLNVSGARVTSLIFRSIDTTQTKGIKIEMVIESATGTSYLSKNFYDTMVLRGTNK